VEQNDDDIIVVGCCCQALKDKERGGSSLRENKCTQWLGGLGRQLEM